MLGQQVEKLRAFFYTLCLSSVTQTIASVVLKHTVEYKDTIAAIISERERMYQKVKEFKKLTYIHQMRISCLEEVKKRFVACNV